MITPTKPQFKTPVSLYSLPGSDIRLDNESQASAYRIGHIRYVRVEQRKGREGQGHVYYYKNTDSLAKALLAKRIDLAVLGPAGARSTSLTLGIQLQSVLTLGWVQTYLVFSPSSPRLGDPMKFCLDFLRAYTSVFDTGELQQILEVNDRRSLLQYYNYTEIKTQQCRTTEHPTENHCLAIDEGCKGNPY